MLLCIQDGNHQADLSMRQPISRRARIYTSLYHLCYCHCPARGSLHRSFSSCPSAVCETCGLRVLQQLRLAAPVLLVSAPSQRRLSSSKVSRARQLSRWGLPALRSYDTLSSSFHLPTRIVKVSPPSILFSRAVPSCLALPCRRRRRIFSTSLPSLPPHPFPMRT